MFRRVPPLRKKKKRIPVSMESKKRSLTVDIPTMPYQTPTSPSLLRPIPDESHSRKRKTKDHNTTLPKRSHLRKTKEVPDVAVLLQNEAALANFVEGPVFSSITQFSVVFLESFVNIPLCLQLTPVKKSELLLPVPLQSEKHFLVSALPTASFQVALY
jgi:hypothetical protein